MAKVELEFHKVEDKLPEIDEWVMFSFGVSQELAFGYYRGDHLFYDKRRQMLTFDSEVIAWAYPPMADEVA